MRASPEKEVKHARQDSQLVRPETGIGGRGKMCSDYSGERLRFAGLDARLRPKNSWENAMGMTRKGVE